MGQRLCVLQLSQGWFDLGRLKREKSCGDSAVALLPSGMLIWVFPQPNHPFSMEFVSRYLSLRPLTYCWTGLKQASSFPFYSCLLPSWGFKSLGATSIKICPSEFPWNTLERDREGGRSLQASAKAVGGCLGVSAVWGSGSLQDTGVRADGEGPYADQGVLLVPGVTLPNLAVLSRCCGNANKVRRMLVRVAV